MDYRVHDFPKECLFAWKARVPVASLDYCLLDVDIDALNSRLNALAGSTKVIVSKGDEGSVFIEAQASNTRCTTTWEIYRAIQLFAGRHAISPLSYQTMCNGSNTDHILEFKRESSPASRGEKLHQLRAALQEGNSPIAIPETCLTQCLQQQRNSTPVTFETKGPTKETFSFRNTLRVSLIKTQDVASSFRNNAHTLRVNRHCALVAQR